jgi:GTP-binding protein
MMNVEEGLTDTDYEIHEMLRRSNKPVYIVINKVDSSKEELAATEFYQLGIEKYYTFLLQQVQEQEIYWMMW